MISRIDGRDFVGAHLRVPGVLKLAYVDTTCLVAVSLNELHGRETAASLARFDRLVASNLLEAELRSASLPA